MPREMPEKTMQLFLIFREAVERERDAQNIYKRAAELCEDKALKKLLERFHKDEVRHEKALLLRYNHLRKKYNVQGG